MGMDGECVGPCSCAGSLTACRFHTGAEQGWTRGMFSRVRAMSTLNITETIKALVVPKAYAPDSTRSSADGPGFNGVCIPDDADLPSSLNYEPYSQKTATPDSNTGTELHTTSMVPRRLRTFGAGPVPNPLHGSPKAVKRWALHFLIGFNETLADTPPPGTYFNPVHYARQFIRVRVCACATACRRLIRPRSTPTEACTRAAPTILVAPTWVCCRGFGTMHPAAAASARAFCTT